MRAEATAMTPLQLVWGITRRMIGWGLVMGALLAAIYGALAGTLVYHGKAKVTQDYIITAID